MKKMYLQLNSNVILIDNYLFPRAIQVEGMKGKVYPINSTGILILSMCDGMHTIEQIIEYVTQKYKVKKSIVKKDTKFFLYEKIKQGVVLQTEVYMPINVNIRGKENIILPYQLSFETTNQCQLKCKHCYNCSGEFRKDELTIDEMIRILDEYKRLGGISVMLTGGEIFLKKDVVKLVEYVANNFLRIVILTNGYHIKEEILQKIVQYKDTIAIQVSIDGLAENHDYVRGVQGAYQNSINNIKKLVSEGVTVSVATTLNEKNANDIYELTEIVKEIGCASINIGAVSSIGKAKENKLGDINIISNMPAIVKKVRELYQTDSFNVGDNIEEFEDMEMIDSTGGKIKNKCGAGYKILHIFADGKIGLCPSHGSIVSKYWIGDLRKNTLEEILEYENMKKILDIPNPSKEECGECNLFDECAKCIISMLNRDENQCILKRKLLDEKITDMQVQDYI